MITILLIVLIVLLLTGGVRWPDSRGVLWTIVLVLILLWAFGVLR